MGSGIHEITTPNHGRLLEHEGDQATHSSSKFSLFTMLVVVGLLLLLFVPLTVGLSVGACNNKNAGHSPNAVSNDSDKAAAKWHHTPPSRAHSSSSISSPATRHSSVTTASRVLRTSSAPPASATPITGVTSNALALPSLWQPSAGTTWQITLSTVISTSGVLTPDVQAYDIDLEEASAQTISALHAKGKKVICYFSGGSYEDWRLDANQFSQADLGNPLDGWPGERWVNIKSQTVRNIMANRIQSAATKGCDAIDPDNIDGYSNNNGLGLTKADSIDYVKWLASEARKYNIACGLKNGGDIVSNVIGDVQFCIQEQCVQWSECTLFAPFVQANKPVFHIEYVGASLNSICSATGPAKGSTGFSTLLKNLDLDGWVQYCP